MSLQISLLTKVLPADKTDHIAVNQPPVSVHITLAVKLLLTLGTTVVFNLVVNRKDVSLYHGAAVFSFEFSCTE